jgi:hypothetical protein
MLPSSLAVTLALAVMTPHPARAAAPDVEAAMLEAATFFQDRLSVEGSYAWIYNAADLANRRGEGVTNLSQGWSQPPGTPAVGLAYLAAFKATGRELFLNAAKETAEALIRTQLQSGGWQGLLEFDPAARGMWCYRIDEDAGRPDCGDIEGNKIKNATTIDDSITQAPLTFLMRLDSELDGAWDEIGEAVHYGLDGLLDAQYPNGSWPMRTDFKVPDELTRSAWRARYPAAWSSTYVAPRGEIYFINDHVIRDVIRVFLMAADLYDEPSYLAAARRGGDFLLAARMPEPQPGWAQMYNADLEPVWGRKFEPPAIAAYETRSSIEALLELYAATGERRYLEGAGPPARWLDRSRLPEGDWARFYELGSNRPLYFDADYQITYDDDEAPEHYKFRNAFGIVPVLERYRHLANNGETPAEENDLAPVPSEAEIEAIIAALDDQGRWVEGDKIHSGSFVRNLTALANFVAARNGNRLPDYLRPIMPLLDR